MPQLIVVGSILTFFSRFGVLVTVAGLWDGSSIPIFCSAFGCPPITTGSGYWLAWAGAVVSLLGRSWVIALPRSVEGRKLLGSIMFPVELVVAILGGLLPFAPYDSFGPEFVLTPVFIATGFSLAGAGLNLYFGLESTTINRIRRALQKPLL